MRPHFLMTDPTCFEVSYKINPWMRPGAWTPAKSLESRASSTALRVALESCGAQVDMIPAVAGQPDLVFPANAAVVLDGVALMARFKCPERQGEEVHFRAAFDGLKARGVISKVVDLPSGLRHEGAGDALWDETRQLFWTGYGQRSDRASSDVVADVFRRRVIPLELASPRFYHLDTCFRPLSAGHVLYYPPAFTPDALAAIEAHVPPAQRIVATDADAQAFCVNAVCIDRVVAMAKPPAQLRERLEAVGYRVVAIDLDPFILSGGAAFCMTLRLDLQSQRALVAA